MHIIYNENIRDFEYVEIEKEFNDIYVLKNKDGLYSKDLVFDNKLDLYISILKERINFRILHFSNDEQENNKRLHKLFGYVFDMNCILENYEKINEDFFHSLKHNGDLKSLKHLYIEQYFIIYYTTLWETRNGILSDRDENYNYKELTKLNTNLRYAEMFLDPKLAHCFGPKINYIELFKLTEINMPLYYAKYNYFFNSIDLQNSNPSPYSIDDKLYQSQFSKTMEDESLVSNIGISFN